jgi:hypothetical protein
MAKQLSVIVAHQSPYIVSFLSDYGFKVTFGDKDNTLFARKAIALILNERRPITSLNHRYPKGISAS